MKTTDKTATKGHDFSAPADVKFPIPGPSDTSSKAKYQIDITDDGVSYLMSDHVQQGYLTGRELNLN